MKTVISVVATVLLSTAAHANEAAEIVTRQPIVIKRQLVGSGEQIGVGEQRSIIVHRQGLLHTPNYLPNYPTAAVIWPRVVEVPCEKRDGKLHCKQFDWTPAYGRGEYIYYKPYIQTLPQCEVPDPVVIYREVPVKRKAE